MGFTGPFIEDSGEDPGRFKGEPEHGWAPDVENEDKEEGHEGTERSLDSVSQPTEESARQ